MAEYLDDAQKAELGRMEAGWLWRTEAPTWALIVAIYGGWYLTLSHWQTLGLPLATALLILFCAWFMSLQHELLHGHPTPWVWVNRILGYAPLSVWYPYTLYRDTHIRHHRDEDLTLPGLDPESYFVTTERWNRLGKLGRAVCHVRNTLLGRLLLGPLIGYAHTLVGTVRQFLRGNFHYLPMWLCHFTLLAAMLVWMDRQFGMSPLYYVLCIAYPGLALAMVRSFFEHQPAEAVKHRCVLNEAALPWRLLFLNNNYHLVHHDLPSVPWYGLPAIYWPRREEYLARNGGFLVHGYGEWVRRFAWRPVARPVHPFANAAHGVSDSSPATLPPMEY